MSHTPCDYPTRTCILPVSWEDYHGLRKALALAIELYAWKIPSV